MDPSSEQSPRIAVIAVHGVADQQPNETARAAADMLLRAERVARDLRQRDIFDPRTGEVTAPELTEPGRYQGFEQRELRIAVEALQTRQAVDSQSDTASPPPKGLSKADIVHYAFSFQQQAKTVTSQLQRKSLDSVPSESSETGDGVAVLERAAPADEISLQYMDEQLAACVIPESEATYETIRLDSVRTGSRTHVHVFEMYWADLSR